MRDQDRKRYLADLTDRYVKRHMGRRDFMRAAGKLGLGIGAESNCSCWTSDVFEHGGARMS